MCLECLVVPAFHPGWLSALLGQFGLWMVMFTCVLVRVENTITLQGMIQDA